MRHSLPYRPVWRRAAQLLEQLAIFRALEREWNPETLPWDIITLLLWHIYCASCDFLLVRPFLFLPVKLFAILRQALVVSWLYWNASESALNNMYWHIHFLRFFHDYFLTVKRLATIYTCLFKSLDNVIYIVKHSIYDH